MYLITIQFEQTARIYRNNKEMDTKYLYLSHMRLCADKGDKLRRIIM